MVSTEWNGGLVTQYWVLSTVHFVERVVAVAGEEGGEAAGDAAGESGAAVDETGVSLDEVGAGARELPGVVGVEHAAHADEQPVGRDGAA